MTQQSPSQVLAQVCTSVRAASPQQWEQFLLVFDAYATEVTVAVTTAPQDQVLNQQGKAQAFLHLLKLFRECHITPPPNQATDT